MSRKLATHVDEMTLEQAKSRLEELHKKQAERFAEGRPFLEEREYDKLVMVCQAEPCPLCTHMFAHVTPRTVCPCCGVGVERVPLSQAGVIPDWMWVFDRRSRTVLNSLWAEYMLKFEEKGKE